MDEFFLDLLTYTCPFTGRKRCAISAELETPMAVKKPLLVEEDAWLIGYSFCGGSSFTRQNSFRMGFPIAGFSSSNSL